MKYLGPLSIRKAHLSPETYSYKCTAGLNNLLVDYLLMPNRHLTGEEMNPKTREELREMSGGMPLLTELCVAMQSDPLGMIRGLRKVVPCIYGPAVTYALPDPLVTAYRHSVMYVSLISILDGTALNWCRQEDLRAQMIETVLFGKVKDPELIVLNFRVQLQCRMREKERALLRPPPKFWNLNLVAKNTREILRNPASKKSFDFVKTEKTLEREVLPATIPEFPMVRRMTLGMNSPMIVPSIQIVRQQKGIPCSLNTRQHCISIRAKLNLIHESLKSSRVQFLPSMRSGK